MRTVNIQNMDSDRSITDFPLYRVLASSRLSFLEYIGHHYSIFGSSSLLATTSPHCLTPLNCRYIVSCIAAVIAISPNFARLYAAKQSAEEAMRFAFSNIRSNVEAIAAYNGDGRERSLVDDRLSATVARTRELIKTQGWFGM